MNDAKQIVFEELQDLQTRIADNIVKKGRNASGRTIESMHIDKGDKSITLFGRKAFGTLETGRGPGNVPKGFYGIIKQWVIDKGLSIKEIPYKRKESEKWHPIYTPKERGLMSLSGAIATKIANEGTKLYRNGGDDDIYSKEIPKTISSIKNRLGIMMKAEVVNSIKLNK